MTHNKIAGTTEVHLSSDIVTYITLHKLLQFDVLLDFILIKKNFF